MMGRGVIKVNGRRGLVKLHDSYFAYNNKAILEPRVSPAFAITSFCNHCNIRFDPMPAKTLNNGHRPLDDL